MLVLNGHFQRISGGQADTDGSQGDSLGDTVVRRRKGDLTEIGTGRTGVNGRRNQGQAGETQQTTKRLEIKYFLFFQNNY